MLINLTNHPSEKWPKEQYECAMRYGGVIDLPFPSINPVWDSAVFDETVDDYIEKVFKLDSNPVVMVQGEFVFTYRIVKKLKEMGIICVAAETKREVVEGVDKEGNPVKTSVFRFEKFMEY